MLTKEQFIADMTKGWETLGYARNWFFVDANNQPVLNVKNAVSACAIGAAAIAAGEEPHPYALKLPGDMWNDIASASNDAGSKEDAIKAVMALEWSEEAEACG